MIAAPRSPITGVPGWESLNEQEALLALAKQVPDGGVIVEIGAEFGMSASLFCLGAKPDVTIYSVDLFPGEMLKQHRRNLKQAGFAEGWFTRSHQIKGDSKELGAHWGKNDVKIDLLFVDGDHSYAGVKADIEGWTPYIKPGGIVAFHDCAPETNHNPHPLHHEVQRAVDEWVEKANWYEYPSVDTMRIFRRRMA